MVKDQTGSYIFSTSNRPRPISFLPPSPPNRGHLSASTPSPSGLAPVYNKISRCGEFLPIPIPRNQALYYVYEYDVRSTT